MRLCFRRAVSSDATISTSGTTVWKAVKEKEEEKKPAFGWRCRFLSYKRRRATLRFPNTIAAGDTEGSSKGTICNEAPLPLNRKLLPKLFRQFILDPKDAKKEQATLKLIKRCDIQTNLSTIQEVIYRARIEGNMQLWMQGRSIREAAAERQHKLSDRTLRMRGYFRNKEKQDRNISNPILEDYYMKPYNTEKKDRAMSYVENCCSYAELDAIISDQRFRYSDGWSIRDAAIKRKATLCGTRGVNYRAMAKYAMLRRELKQQGTK